MGLVWDNCQVGRGVRLVRARTVYCVPPAADCFYITKDNIGTLDVGDATIPMQKRMFDALVCRYGTLFAHELSELDHTSLVQCDIELLPSTRPMCTRKIQRWQPEIEDFARMRCVEFLAANMIEEYYGPWGAGTIFPKRNPGHTGRSTAIAD